MKKKRFCRFCQKELEYNYFFCGPACQEDYLMALIQEEEEFKRVLRKKESRVMFDQCKKCKRECKIFVEKAIKNKVAFLCYEQLEKET